MTHPDSVVFCDPPQRGLASPVSEFEAELVNALRRAPGQYALLGVVRAHAEAETLRRRVHRGRGVWQGGPSTWDVVVRKTSYARQVPEWRVYVAHRGAPVLEVAQ